MRTPFIDDNVAEFNLFISDVDKVIGKFKREIRYIKTVDIDLIHHVFNYLKIDIIDNLLLYNKMAYSYNDVREKQENTCIRYFNEKSLMDVTMFEIKVLHMDLIKRDICELWATIIHDFIKKLIENTTIADMVDYCNLPTSQYRTRDFNKFLKEKIINK